MMTSNTNTDDDGGGGGVLHSSSDTAKNKLNKLGISICWLTSDMFMNEIKSEGYNENSTIYDIEPNVIRKKGKNVVCPIDGKIGAAYMHCFDNDDDNNEKGDDVPVVGNASFVVSYCWKYSIGDIIAALDEYCRDNNLNPKTTYVWIDCLCLNQHRFLSSSDQLQQQRQDSNPIDLLSYHAAMMTTMENKKAKHSGLFVPAIEFYDLFSDLVSDVGHMIVMVKPISDPSCYLKRVWCLFELFIAIQLQRQKRTGTKISIVMTPNEKQMMKQAITDDHGKIDLIYDTLLIDKLRIEKSHASIIEDKTQILDMLKSNDIGGYKKINHQIRNFFLQWLRGMIREVVFNNNSKAHCIESNNKRSDIDDDDDDDRRQQQQQLANVVAGEGEGQDLSFALFCHKVGELFYRNGDYDESMNMYMKSLATYESVLGKNHADTASARLNIGMILQEKGDYDKALIQYQMALKTFESTSCVVVSNDDRDETMATTKAPAGVNSNNSYPKKTASCYNSIGNLLYNKGNYDGALVNYEKGLFIREKVVGKNHPDTLTSYNNLGNALYSKCDFNAALDMYQAALTLSESIFGIEHQYTATAYNNIGLVLHQQGKYDDALVKYQRALEIRKSILLGNRTTIRGGGKEKKSNSSSIIMNYPEIIESYNNIGNALYKKGDYEGALKKYRKVIRPKIAFDPPTSGGMDNNDEHQIYVTKINSTNKQQQEGCSNCTVS